MIENGLLCWSAHEGSAHEFLFSVALCTQFEDMKNKKICCSVTLFLSPTALEEYCCSATCSRCNCFECGKHPINTRLRRFPSRRWLKARLSYINHAHQHINGIICNANAYCWCAASRSACRFADCARCSTAEKLRATLIKAPVWRTANLANYIIPLPHAWPCFKANKCGTQQVQQFY